MSKQEEGKLTLIERTQLKLHLGICDFCTRFQQQTKLFTSHAHHSHEHNIPTLSAEKKQAIKAMLKDH